MKNGYKLVGLVVSLMILGIVLVGVGIVNGGKTNIDVSNMFDRQDNGDDESGLTRTEILEAYDSLELKADVAQIEIVKGDKYSLSISGIKKKDISYKVQNHKLLITQKSHRRLSIGFKTLENITITIPENVEIQDFQMECGIGDVIISDVSSNNMSLKVGVGTVKINNVSADTCKIRGGVGEVTADTFTANKLDVEAGVGEIDMQGDFKGDINLRGGIGEIVLKASGQKSDFNYEFEKGIGEMKLNGESVGNIKNSENDASKTITAKTGIGSIDVYIEE